MLFVGFFGRKYVDFSATFLSRAVFLFHCGIPPFLPNLLSGGYLALWVSVSVNCNDSHARKNSELVMLTVIIAVIMLSEMMYRKMVRQVVRRMGEFCNWLTH